MNLVKKNIFLYFAFIGISLILLFISTVKAERYEPLIGKSGSVIDFGGIRFIAGWGYNELNDNSISAFNFGLDFGIGLRTELQNRIDYNNSAANSEYQWTGWTEILKFRLSERENGPAFCLGTGLRIPLRKSESLGALAGLYISSALKDIDFDFNIGINPYITYADLGKLDGVNTYYSRPHHYINVVLLLGKKFLPFLKVNAGFEMRQLLKSTVSKIKYSNGDTEKFTDDGGASWTFLIGSRIKPIGYPILLDSSLAFGTGKDAYKSFDWQFKLGVQLLPQSPNAEW
ncbi:MAG: hypothetical protein ACTSQG_11950 [Promethearchaeota archaeon]